MATYTAYALITSVTEGVVSGGGNDVVVSANYTLLGSDTTVAGGGDVSYQVSVGDGSNDIQAGVTTAIAAHALADFSITVRKQDVIFVDG